MNGQAVYRISLAISDFFAGTVIFPTFVITTIYQSLVVNADLRVKIAYVDAVGFIMWLSLHVSTFTLVAAAIDRFKVVYRPLSYNVKSSISTAWKTCAVLWIISIILAALPLGVVAGILRYEIIVAGVSIPYLNISFYGYFYISCVFVFPVILMWIFTIITFVFYKKYSKKRQNILSTNSKKKEMKKQTRLLFTLGIMVVVFSVCILPFVILCVLAFHNIIHGKSMATGLMCSAVLCTSNSLWNFFIYKVRDKAFRKTSKNLYKKLLCCSK